VSKILEYLDFQSVQNQYEYQDETSFFPPTLETESCFSRHLLVNRFLQTKMPKFLYWSIEADPNVLMDPFCMETICYWTDSLNESNKENKEAIKKLLLNIGIALSKPRNLSKSFHYETGYVHYLSEKTEPYISFEVHPPRRCFRLVESFERVVSKIKQIEILGMDLKVELENKYSLVDLNVNFSDKNHVAAQVISRTHNNLQKNKNDKSDLFLTPHIAEEIYKDAKVFCRGLKYIVDTFQIVDYWSPDKKR
tara:strand:- start:4784 stop:5536 length:753 start_codon:yes stop_codon:yes gene_type:complete